MTLEARLYPGSEGMWLEGKHQLRMSEFNIRPPTMMLGTIRVGDLVTIQYRLLLVDGGGAGPSSAHSGH